MHLTGCSYQKSFCKPTPDMSSFWIEEKAVPDLSRNVFGCMPWFQKLYSIPDPVAQIDENLNIYIEGCNIVAAVHRKHNQKPNFGPSKILGMDTIQHYRSPQCSSPHTSCQCKLVVTNSRCVVTGLRPHVDVRAHCYNHGWHWLFHTELLSNKDKWPPRVGKRLRRWGFYP